MFAETTAAVLNATYAHANVEARQQPRVGCVAHIRIDTYLSLYIEKDKGANRATDEGYR